MTTRGPVRSDKAPHRNDPIPSVIQASSATAEMSVRLHPVALWIGARNTPSENNAPMETRTIAIAAASRPQGCVLMDSIIDEGAGRAADPLQRGRERPYRYGLLILSEFTPPALLPLSVFVESSMRGLGDGEFAL